ncbi:hypothetical protein KCV03_g143, partial [Aureobasidium melanogenum]
LIEGIEEFGDERGARRRSTESLHETKLLQITDEAIGCVVRESQRVSPEVPLESDNRARCHTSPNHTESRFSSCQTRDVGLVTRLVPLIQVLGGYKEESPPSGRVPLNTRRWRSEMGRKGLNARASNVVDPESEVILHRKGEIDVDRSEGPSLAQHAATTVIGGKRATVAEDSRRRAGLISDIRAQRAKTMILRCSQTTAFSALAFVARVTIKETLLTSIRNAPESKSGTTLIDLNRLLAMTALVLTVDDCYSYCVSIATVSARYQRTSSSQRTAELGLLSLDQSFPLKGRATPTSAALSGPVRGKRTATRVKKAATAHEVWGELAAQSARKIHTFLSFRERTLRDGLAPDREMVSHYMFIEDNVCVSGERITNGLPLPCLLALSGGSPYAWFLLLLLSSLESFVVDNSPPITWWTCITVHSTVAAAEVYAKGRQLPVWPRVKDRQSSGELVRLLLLTLVVGLLLLTLIEELRVGWPGKLHVREGTLALVCAVESATTTTTSASATITTTSVISATSTTTSATTIGKLATNWGHSVGHHVLQVVRTGKRRVHILGFRAWEQEAGCSLVGGFGLVVRELHLLICDFLIVNVEIRDVGWLGEGDRVQGLLDLANDSKTWYSPEVKALIRISVSTTCCTVPKGVIFMSGGLRSCMRAAVAGSSNS